MMDGQPQNILCCMCGVVTPANPANMCVNCLRSRVDITEGIAKEIAIPWCKGCGRYAHGIGWVAAAPESRELLAMLVRKVRGLQRVKLVDASFVYTEPHSKRLKVKLTVQREVFGTGASAGGAGAIMQQAFVVDYVLENLYCADCHKAQSPHTWTAQVQLRQHGVGHKRTLYYIEQLILRRGAHVNVISLRELPDGLDFFFVNASHAKRFVEFLVQIAPVHATRSKKLIAHDDRSNVFSYKYTWLAEVAPICRDDLVVLPRGGRFGQGGVFVCTRVTSSLHFIDPLSLRRVDVTAPVYWSAPFPAVCSSRRLEEFTVLDSEETARQRCPTVPAGESFGLADVTVVRTRDLGVNDDSRVVPTHLGRFLHAGDLAMGYDLATETFDVAESAARGGLGKRIAQQLPEVILVRKGFRRNRRSRRRIWMLQRLERDGLAEDADSAEGAAAAAADRRGDEGADQRDMEQLMQDLEEDPEMRASVALVRAPDAEQIIAARADVGMVDEGEDGGEDEDDEPEYPDVQISELVEPMQNLTLSSRLAAATAAAAAELPQAVDEDD